MSKAYQSKRAEPIEDTWNLSCSTNGPDPLLIALNMHHTRTDVKNEPKAVNSGR